MTINYLELLNLPINYNGTFTDCEIDSRIKNKIGRTNFPTELFQRKKLKMEKYKIKELKSLLSSQFNNDIELLAKATGIPTNELSDFINEASNLTLTDDESSSNKENVQFVGKIEGDQIIVSGGEFTKNCGISSLENETSKLKMEISDFKKLLKEKDTTIKALNDEIGLLKESKKNAD